MARISFPLLCIFFSFGRALSIEFPVNSIPCPKQDIDAKKDSQKWDVMTEIVGARKWGQKHSQDVLNEIKHSPSSPLIPPPSLG